MCLVITLWYESVFFFFSCCFEWFKHIIAHTHTHTGSHTGSCYAADLGRKTKADRSERRYNQPWVLRKKQFAPSFQSSFTSSHLNTIHHHHHYSLFLFHPPLAWSSHGGWWCRRKQTGFKVWTAAAQDPQHQLCDGAHVEAALRCRVQLNQKVYCKVCVCVSVECVSVGVIEKHGFPQRDPPLIVKWRSLRATPGTSIKHRQATDNLSLSLPLSPLSFSLTPHPLPSFIL